MMKKLSFLLILILIFCLFTACTEEGDKFEFTYETERQVYLVGETVKITAKVTNISGRTYRWTYGPYIPGVKLYPILDDGTPGEPLEQSPYLAIEYAPERHKAKNGESGETTVSFPIPEDAQIGKYTVELLFGGEVEVFPEAINVLKAAEQNENEKYAYSSIVVAMGEDGIRPIQCMLSGSHYVNGEMQESGSSDGVYYLFRNPETDPNDFPVLVLNGKIELYVPTHISYNERLTLYDLNYEPLEYNGDFEGLSSLPAGEYLVVFSEYHSGEVDNPQDYWKAHYENLFKLIVRTKSPKYEFCTTSIISGGSEINPIRVYIGYSEYKNNELVETVEIPGYEYIFSSDMYDVAEFPTLVLNGDISARPPVNVRIYDVAIYDTDYNRLKYSFDSLTELSELPAGEYVVIYYEEADGRGCDPEIGDYRITKSVGVFKLAIPENTVPAFSFADESKMYKENDPGVKTDGFKNISKVEIIDRNAAVERAKNECTIGYDSTSVSFDSAEEVWKIVFSTKGVLGGCQSVYLDKNGVTLLIVYGE